MIRYKNISKEFVAPVDLQTLGTTFSTLEKGHQEAVKTASELKTAMANLDLNEAEDEYKQNKINEIQNTIEANTTYGNMYSALDDIVAKAGDLSRDPGILGRLRAQKDYKEYIDNLNKRTDISEADKEYFREVNKYYYEDKYDKNGNVVGGTKWNPLDREVASPDIAKISAQAIAIAAKDAGGSSSVYYKTADGRYTTNAALSVDNLPYFQKEGKFERLTKDKIRNALKFVISNTPGAAEGLQQDFKIAKWRHDKSINDINNNNKLVIDDTTDDKGLPLDFNQYMEKRLQGFYASATYNHYYGKNTPLAGMSVQAAKARTASLNNSIANAVLGVKTTTPGNYYIEKHSALSGIVGKNKAAIEQLKYFADNNGIKMNLSDIGSVYKQLKDIYDKKGEIMPKAAYDAYNAYLDGINKYNQLIPEGADKEAIEFTSALENGIDISLYPNNKYAIEYQKIINNKYNNGEPKFYLQGDFNETLKQIPEYKSLGLQIKIDENKHQYLTLPKEYSNNLYNVSSILQPYLNRPLITNYDNYNFALSPVPVPVTYMEDTNNIIDWTMKLYGKANKEVEKVINPNNILIPTELVSDKDVVETLVKDQWGYGKWSDYNQAVKDVNNSIWSSILQSYGSRVNMGIGIDNQPMSYNNTGGQRDAAKEIIRRIKESDSELVSLSYDKNTLKSYVDVAIPTKIKEDETIKEYLKVLGAEDAKRIIIIADNFVNNTDKNNILNSFEFATHKSFYDETIAGVTSFDNADGSTIYSNGTGESYILNKNGVNKPINRGTALSIYRGNNLYNDIKYAYDAAVNKYGEDLPNEVYTSMHQQLLQLVKYYSPEDINVTKHEDLSINGKLIYQDFINQIQQ